VRKKQELTSFRVSELDFVGKPMGTQEISRELHGTSREHVLRVLKVF
jgi:hypothetical protein